MSIPVQPTGLTQGGTGSQTTSSGRDIFMGSNPKMRATSPAESLKRRTLPIFPVVQHWVALSLRKSECLARILPPSNGSLKGNPRVSSRKYFLLSRDLLLGISIASQLGSLSVRLPFSREMRPPAAWSLSSASSYGIPIRIFRAMRPASRPPAYLIFFIFLLSSPVTRSGIAGGQEPRTNGKDPYGDSLHSGSELSMEPTV